MTWEYEIGGLGSDSQTLHVYDHTGTEVYSETRAGWSGDEIEAVVKEAMDTEAVAAYNANDTLRMLQCLRHGSFDIIEER